ncbi:MAG: glycoside hydrolase family 2 protein, partial [Gaiellales bacterium]
CLRVPRAAPWLPHTHGDPALHVVHVELVLDDGRSIRVGERRVGFRTVDAGVDLPGDDGLALSISGVPVFCRGALWTPVDPVALAAPSDRVRERLVQLRDAGLNMVRVPGTGVYEEDAFHAACDELGILVWHDLMLANMDYPVDDPAFAALLGREVEVELERLGGHASTAVVCGGSEVEQQATMVGLPPSAARNAFVATTLPALALHACPGIPVVPSSPCGGDLPFRTAQGIAHYFGVGAYLRPLADARAAAVRFASECLAFANVPEQATLDAMSRGVPGGITPTHPAWKRGVPRDTGAGWDFDDVRDRYLALLYDVDPVLLRSTDPELYLELSRLVSGEVMAEVVGEWRRTGSPCAGALVLQAGDLVPGAGWGLIDAGGTPKPAYHVLRRACLSRAVWSTDEGLDGIDVHVANDASEPLFGELHIVLMRLDGRISDETRTPLALPARASVTFGVEALLGRFVDAAYAYRFGPRGHDLVVASVRADGDDVPGLVHVRHLGPRPTRRETTARLGLTGTLDALPDGMLRATVRAEALA